MKHAALEAQNTFFYNIYLFFFYLKQSDKQQ